MPGFVGLSSGAWMHPVKRLDAAYKDTSFDRLGFRVGKLRLSVFGLRPRNTAILISILTGMLITLISCHQGLAAENGAVGVGSGTTRAVVISSLVLLVVNFFLSILLNYVFPIGNA